jgi:glutamine amidotransferase
MIALIDYNMGNLLSVSKALEHVGGDIRVTDCPADVAIADAVVLPGVGNFGDGMEHLRSRGFAEAVIQAVKAGKPLLGICLGMQMLLDCSEEAPNVAGLGIIPGKVKRFPDSTEKIPHIGWNSVKAERPCPLMDGLADETFFYFVHSYYACPASRDKVIGSCDYIVNFAAIIGGGNIFATQFHPEKSQNAGIRILENFVNSVPLVKQ